jgi:hypothetical protein
MDLKLGLGEPHPRMSKNIRAQCLEFANSNMSTVAGGYVSSRAFGCNPVELALVVTLVQRYAPGPKTPTHSYRLPSPLKLLNSR